MIDMYDIPASWVGELIEVHRAGFHTTGTVTGIESNVEYQDYRALRGREPESTLRSIAKTVDIRLLTLEGNLTFENLVKGAYEIDLINKEGN